MSNFRIEITETLQRTVDVEADTYYKTLDKIQDMYSNQEIELNADNSYVTVEFQDKISKR